MKCPNWRSFFNKKMTTKTKERCKTFAIVGLFLLLMLVLFKPINDEVKTEESEISEEVKFTAVTFIPEEEPQSVSVTLLRPEQPTLTKWEKAGLTKFAGFAPREPQPKQTSITKK